MFGAASASMGFALGCGLAPAERSSNGVVTKGAPDSRPDGRGFVSLRRRAAFEQLYRCGRRQRIGKIVVISAPNAEGTVQVGFVAGRRVGGAVERNRAKRRLRAAMARVPLPAGASFIVVASPGVNEASFQKLVEWLVIAVTHEADRLEEER